MVRTCPQHAFSIKKAHEAQERLSKLIVHEDRLPRRIRFVGGVDTAYSADTSIGAATRLDFDSLKPVETQIAVCRTRFPYIPTLLSFREILPSVLSIRKLHARPDVVLVDGHGFAHPHRCGFASHLGLVLRLPTIGVAKTLLVGKVESLGSDRDQTLLTHNGEVLGEVVTTERGQKPIYVSVGHMISLETAVKIVKSCVAGNRIPLPISMAHERATSEKRKINNLSQTKAKTE